MSLANIRACKHILTWCFSILRCWLTCTPLFCSPRIVSHFGHPQKYTIFAFMAFLLPKSSMRFQNGLFDITITLAILRICNSYRHANLHMSLEPGSPEPISQRTPEKMMLAFHPSRLFVYFCDLA